MIKETSFYIFLKNCFTVISWFLFKKRNTSVIFFEIPSSLLLSYLDCDVKNTVSNRINDIKNLDLSNIDKDKIFNDPDFESLKKLLKISWLISSLREKGNVNPVQFLQSENGKYFCHPGTDRVLVLTYIDPVETVTGFYIWYRDLDPTPFFLDFDHKIINNPFSFLTKFQFNGTLSFKKVIMNKSLDVSDKINSNAMFSTSKNCFEKIQKDYCIEFLSYYDSAQWKELDMNFDVDNYIKISKNEIILADIKFKKLNNVWIPQYD